MEEGQGQFAASQPTETGSESGFNLHTESSQSSEMNYNGDQEYDPSAYDPANPGYDPNAAYYDPNGVYNSAGYNDPHLVNQNAGDIVFHDPNEPTTADYPGYTAEPVAGEVNEYTNDPTGYTAEPAEYEEAAAGLDSNLSNSGNKPAGV